MPEKVSEGGRYFDEVIKRTMENEAEYYRWTFNVLHVSDCCYCDRALWYRTHDENTAKQMADEKARSMDWDLQLGKTVHAGMEKMIGEADLGLSELEYGPMPIGDTAFSLTGKIDLLRWNDDLTQGEIVDFKTIRATFPGLVAKPTHIQQVGLYLKLLHDSIKRENNTTGDKVVAGRIVYISKGIPKTVRVTDEAWEPVMEFTVSEHELFQAGSQRLAEVERIIKSPNWDTGPNEKWMCSYCGWKAVCPHGQKEVGIDEKKKTT